MVLRSLLTFWRPALSTFWAEVSCALGRRRVTSRYQPALLQKSTELAMALVPRHYSFPEGIFDSLCCVRIAVEDLHGFSEHFGNLLPCVCCERVVVDLPKFIFELSTDSWSAQNSFNDPLQSLVALGAICWLQHPRAPPRNHNSCASDALEKKVRFVTSVSSRRVVNKETNIFVQRNKVPKDLIINLLGSPFGICPVFEGQRSRPFFLEIIHFCLSLYRGVRMLHFRIPCDPRLIRNHCSPFKNNVVFPTVRNVILLVFAAPNND